jgi:hypothetical protein
MNYDFSLNYEFQGNRGGCIRWDTPYCLLSPEEIDRIRPIVGGDRGIDSAWRHGRLRIYYPEQRYSYGIACFEGDTYWHEAERRDSGGHGSRRTRRVS